MQQALREFFAKYAPGLAGGIAPLQSLHLAASNQFLPNSVGSLMVPLGSKIGPAPVGFRFGSSHGFTHTGAMGPPDPKEIVTPEGL